MALKVMKDFMTKLMVMLRDASELYWKSEKETETEVEAIEMSGWMKEKNIG